MTFHFGIFGLFVSEWSVLGALSFCLSLARLHFTSASYVPLYASGFLRCVGPYGRYSRTYLGVPSLFCLQEHEHYSHFLTVRIILLGMSFFRATLLEWTARCTQTCLATLTVSVFLFSHLGCAFFVVSSLVFISLCTVPPDPFLSDSFLAFVFCWPCRLSDRKVKFDQVLSRKRPRSR